MRLVGYYKHSVFVRGDKSKKRCIQLTEVKIDVSKGSLKNKNFT